MNFCQCSDTLKEVFSNHKATDILNNKEIEILDWQNKNGSAEYKIRYILDKSRGSLIIQGDCGSAIFSWYNPNITMQDIANYAQNVDYFIEKIQCSCDIYTYYLDDIVKDLYGILEVELFDYAKENYKEYRREVKEYLEEVKTNYNIYDSLEDVRKEYKNNADEMFGINAEGRQDFDEAGERISERIFLWAIGLKMAIEDLKNNGQ